jgi:lipopolysaccharide/colanic/teichoic acid biosynthesis glycosyltransferase/glycosyltransferase involved in cell wall biosynthesis
MTSPKYSVIIPAYQAAHVIGDCLRALEVQTVPRERYEVIVVDDGSTDGTAAAAHEAGADRVLVRAHQGPAVARNEGVAESSGEIVLFTDADCAPTRDWIEKMAQAFDAPEVVGAKGTYRTRQRQVVARFVQLEYEHKYARMAQQEWIDFIDTYSAAYRKDVFLANGGFDHLFTTASVEDQEFSFRLARKGYRLTFAPDAVVYHQHDATLYEYWRRKFGIGYWKALLLRWHPERVTRDSHTPPTLKAQIGLMGFFGLTALLAIFWTPALWATLIMGALFLFSAMPFLARIIRRDWPVALAAPVLLVTRAAALGSGLGAGFLRFSRRTDAHRPPIGGLNRVLKRAMDIVGSVMGLILTGPLLPVAAAAIKIDSPGPAFFFQERAGENGHPFQVIKLRTMVDGAEEMLSSLAKHESSAEPILKLRDDPRVTRVGRFLRRTSLDEAPQFWNVLKGEMSLVGPRPEEVRVVEGFYSDWHRQRLAVKPGITGPMQVNGRGDLTLDERVQLELDYIQNHSIWKDITLLARTVVAVISGHGAY